MKTYEVWFAYTDYEDGEEPEGNTIQVEAKDMAEAVINTRKRLGDCIQILDIKEV